jgi:hypothetical protein
VLAVGRTARLCVLEVDQGDVSLRALGETALLAAEGKRNRTKPQRTSRNNGARDRRTPVSQVPWPGPLALALAGSGRGSDSESTRRARLGLRFDRGPLPRVLVPRPPAQAATEWPVRARGGLAVEAPACSGRRRRQRQCCLGCHWSVEGASSARLSRTLHRSGSGCRRPLAGAPASSSCRSSSAL